MSEAPGLPGSASLEVLESIPGVQGVANGSGREVSRTVQCSGWPFLAAALKLANNQAQFSSLSRNSIEYLIPGSNSNCWVRDRLSQQQKVDPQRPQVLPKMKERIHIWRARSRWLKKKRSQDTRSKLSYLDSI